MYARRLMLTVLGSGVLLGAMAGLAIDTTMTPLPERPWRHAGHAQATNEDFLQAAETGPQDLSPWSNDRTPTWKRGRQPLAATYIASDDSSIAAETPRSEQASSADVAMLDGSANAAGIAAIDAQAKVDVTQSVVQPQISPDAADLTPVAQAVTTF